MPVDPDWIDEPVEKGSVAIKEKLKPEFKSDAESLRALKWEADMVSPYFNYDHSSLTEAQQVSIGMYTSQHYGHVNKYLRGKYDFKSGRGKAKELLDTSIHGVDSAFNKIGKNRKKVVYRGIHPKSGTARRLRDGASSLDEMAYTSTTKDIDVAKTYANNNEGLILEIDTSHVRSIDLEAEDLAFIGGESEVLLERGIVFDVERVSDVRYKLIAHKK